MKKLLATALATLTILSATTPAFATDELQRTLDRTTIKVGYLEDYGIITTPIVQGAEGFGYEYLEKLEEYTDYHFEYVPLSWTEGLEQLKDGEIDVLAPAAMSQERKAAYDYVETVFSYEEIDIYALEDSDYHFNEPEQLNGKTFGAMEGGIYEERLAAYAKEHDLDYALTYMDHATVIEDINMGKMDLYVDSSLYVRDGVYSVGKISTEELYLMTQKGNDTLTNTLNSALLALEQDDPFFNETLWSKYYGTSRKATQKLTADERTALETKEVYTVGYHADLQPVSYTLDGEPKGYAVDVMNLLADKLNIKVTYLPFHDGSENSPEDVDFNLCPMNDEGVIHGILSVPYDTQRLLAARDEGLEKSEVQHILVPDFATIAIEDCLELYPSATIHKTYSTADCTRILGMVDIDCTILPDNSESLLQDKGNRRINVLDVSLPMGITVSHELPVEVRTALNKTILSLKASTVDDLLMDNVRALQMKPTLLDTLGNYRLQITTIFLFIAVAFGFILWRSRKKTKQLLEVDTLTGSMTKFKFTQEARRILQTAKPNEYMMILLDVDKFKTINKVYGTQIGDKLLCVLADSLKKQIKKDTIVGRIQSDAFAILTKAKSIAHVPLDDMFLQELKTVGIDMNVHFSIGVYLVENTTDDISYMLDNARTAKGNGKATFGNTVHYFTKELQEKYEKESAILSSMEAALANEEFFIMVQPKVELQTERLVGGEVLVRWKKKDGTWIYPDEFIPLFEENKFIIQLDRYVLEKTCAYIQDSKLTLPVLSVNVSAITMMEEDFVQYGLDVLARYGVIPQQIEVELTENVLDYDYKRISKAISGLKKAGFSIAIDDFGKGASSLARIKEIEMDVLKLDKDFMEDNTENEKGKLVLNNIISMASDLGIISLAEGIETKEQKDLLIQLGCDQGQGYHFDRPLSTMDFSQRVVANSKVAFEPVLRYQKDCRFWAESKDLPYGVVVAKNDPYSTIIHANDGFYDIIGHSKESFQRKHNNRLTSILVDNLYNLVKKHLAEKEYDFTFDLRLLASNGEIVWAQYIIKYAPADNLFFGTLIKTVDQSYLTDNTVAHHDFVQESQQVSEELEKVLHKIRDSYDADRAYFVQFSKDEFVLNNYQEVLKTGIPSQKHHFLLARETFLQPLTAHLKKVDTVYMDVASLEGNAAHQPLVDAYHTSGTTAVVYSAIKDADDHFWGFVGLDNPKQQTNSFHFLENEASYIGAYLVQSKFKELAKQNRIQEESSKAGIINLCINMLRTPTTTTTNSTTTTVLELLREHYEAKSCAIVQFSPAEQTYKLRHMNIDLADYPHFDAVQTFSFQMIEKTLETFVKNKYALISCKTEDFIESENEQSKYKMIGVENGYLAPMFDIDNNCNGFLVITNPILTTRSPMLIQIVSKFLSDYQAKYDIYLEQKSKISIEPMTGLLNKVVTEETIETLLHDGQTGALYMVDVDNFKQINDKLGHAMGDAVIVDNAKTLRKIFRKDDVIGRVGGDEFIIYAPDLITREAVSRKAEQIVQAFAKTYEKNGIAVDVSASVGVHTAWKHGETFQHLYQEADKALYRAKAQGKNQYQIFATTE